MSGRLTVETVVLNGFGGVQTQTKLTLPSTGLVVLEGPNESGKSTFAEAIGWLLAGPTPITEVVSRLGDRGDTLEARMNGTIDRTGFSVSGRFEIMANNKARLRQLDCTLGGGEVSADEFRQRIGLSEPTVYHHVFRIDGADGHRPSTAEEVVARAASGVFGPVDPHEVGELLEDGAKLLGKSGAASADSVRKRTRAITDLQQQLEEAGREIEEYRDQVALAEQAASDASSLKAHLDDLRVDSAALTGAKDLAVKQADLVAKLSDLEGIGVPDSAWAGLLGRLDELKSAHHDLHHRGDGLGRAVEAGKAAAVRRSTTVEILAGTIIDEAVTNQLVESAQRAEDAREAVRVLEQRLIDTEREAGEAEENLRNALAAIGPAASRPGFELNLRLDDGTPLIQRAEAVRTAQGTCEQADTACRTAKGNAAAAKADVDRALDRFEVFGAGMEAEAVLNLGVTANAVGSRSGKGTWVRWFAPVALLVIAGVAALSKQYVLAGIAAVAAVATVFTGQRATSQPSPSPGSVVTDELRDAALEVRDARKDADEKARAADEAARAAGVAEQDLQRKQDGLKAALTEAGLPADTSFDRVGHLVTTWKAAVDAASLQRSAIQESQRVDNELQAARETCRVTADQLASELEPFGLEPAGPPEVASALAKLSQDAALARSAVDADGALTDLRAAIASLLAPVGLAQDDSPDAISTCEQLQQEQARRAALEAKTQELSQDIAAQRELSPRAAALADEYRDLVELERAEHELSRKISALDEEYKQALNRQATAEAEARRLLDADHISELEQQLSENNAAANDIAIDAVAHALARILVAEEADREERNRQPVLIERTSQIATSVAAEWSEVRLVRPPAGERGGKLVVDLDNGSEVPAHQLSTGARMALYLSLRVAMADNLTSNSNVALRLICDDPLAHIDGDRAPMVMQVLAKGAKDRQVILLTCHESTVELAVELGAELASLPKR